MASAVVFGAGMVGSVIAADLAAEHGMDVSIADVSADALVRVDGWLAQPRPAGNIATVQCDLSDPAAVSRLAAKHEIAIGALPGRLGFQTLRAMIEAGRPCCDISFMPEDPLALNELARRRGVTAVVDCGVAPGLSNILAAWGAARLGRCRRIAICVGGLPRQPRWPFNYKAGFSPADVIEEYTRPAKIVEAGRVVTRDALSEAETIEFPGVGTLEAFNTDGLRTLIHSLDVPEMCEKTLRYPGHAELMRIFREAGFFGRDPIRAGDVSVAPLDVTSALLFPQWTYEVDEEDLTVMRIVVEGAPGGPERSSPRRRIEWNLLHFYDRERRQSSMARTTALPCTIIARRILAGAIAEPGVIPPERIAQIPGEAGHVVAELAKRGVMIHEAAD